MSDPTLPTYSSQRPEDAPLFEALSTHFQLTAFRPGQLEVLRAVRARRDAIAVMPTGSGKSLCFQLPALLEPGVGVVVSPLISLMHDQVASLRSRGINAIALNSSLSASERSDNVMRLFRGDVKLLYASPEGLQHPGLRARLRESGVNVLAIDEAHCISRWGHDFRPEYGTLRELRLALAPQSTLAVTATATPEVRSEIATSLGLHSPRVVVSGFDRPNITFAAVYCRNRAAKDTLLVHAVKCPGPGLIYCSTRKEAERIFASLRPLALKRLRLFHAGLAHRARVETHDFFRQSHDAIVVATSAFGLGIDKAGVRFVVHASLPATLEDYFQEIGRAGRDGGPAEATLLFNGSDVLMQERLLEVNQPPAPLVSDLWAVLRSPLGPSQSVDQLAMAVGASPHRTLGALRLLQRVGAVSKGPGRWELRIQCDFGHLPIDWNFERTQARRGAALLARMHQYAQTHACRRGVLLGYFGQTVSGRCSACDNCLGKRTSPLPAPKRRPGSKVRTATARDVAVEALALWRRELADALGLPDYAVLPERALLAAARLLPRTREEFLVHPSLTADRWERFGPAVVRVCTLARAQAG